MTRRTGKQDYRYPLTVWMIWQVDSESADTDPCYELARALYRKLGGEWLATSASAPDADIAALPSVEMDLPVFFLGIESPSIDTIEAALAAQSSECCIVLLVIDLKMLKQLDGWRPIVEDLYEMAAGTEEFQIVAVSATDDAHNFFPQTRAAKALEVDLENPEGRFYIDVLALLCRRLLAPLPLPRVLLSHAKEEAGELTEELRRHIRRGSGLKPWFDESDLDPGEVIREQLKSIIPESFFVAVATEQYVRRRWTRWEASLARQHNRPMVVIDAIEGTLRRLPPELANAPVLRWPEGTSSTKLSEQVPALVLTELLRHTYHQRYTEIVKNATAFQDRGQIVATLLPPGPPVTWYDGRKQIRIYADPPLTEEELALQRQSEDVRFVTLTQYVADCGWMDGAGHEKRGLEGIRIGVSVSAPSDSKTFGLHEDQFRDLSVRLARDLVYLGADLAYGGDLRPGGLTDHLARVVDQYAPEKIVVDVLHAYVSWPFYRDWSDDDIKQRLKQCEPKRIGPGPGVDRNTNPDFDTDRGLTDFARALTHMRREMTENCQARVSIGGPVAGSKGRMPGIVEEVYLALSADQPVYLVSAFGGATQALFDCLDGKTVAEFSYQHQNEQWLKYGAVLKGLEGTEDDVDWDIITSYLQEEVGLQGLAERNGLSIEDNRRLAQAHSPAEITYWIAKGLGAVFGRDR